VGRQTGVYGNIGNGWIYYFGGEKKMKKLTSLLIMILFLSCFSNITLAETGSTELIEKGKEFDQQAITFSGEVIGDPMSRGAYVWLNVKDKDNAMGIWVKKDILPTIKYYGSYNCLGDEVVIQGIFHRSCIEHGGDMDIHAASIFLSKTGHPLEHRVQAYQWLMAVIFLFTAGLAFLLYRLKEKGQPINGG
jgi:hypothetical protein